MATSAAYAGAWVSTRTPALRPSLAPLRPRERVLAEARAILRVSGFDGFTIDAVARRSGVSRRTVYNHFQDREALYRASRLGLLAAIEDRLPRVVNTTAPQHVALTRFCAEAITAFDLPEHRELAASAQRDALAAPWLAELYRTRIERPLQTAIELHLLRCGQYRSDPAPQARALLAMLKAAVFAEETGAAFDAEELATIFLARLRLGGSARYCGAAATIRY